MLAKNAALGPVTHSSIIDSLRSTFIECHAFIDAVSNKYTSSLPTAGPSSDDFSNADAKRDFPVGIP